MSLMNTNRTTSGAATIGARAKDVAAQAIPVGKTVAAQAIPGERQSPQRPSRWERQRSRESARAFRAQRSGLPLDWRTLSWAHGSGLRRVWKTLRMSSTPPSPRRCHRPCGQRLPRSGRAGRSGPASGGCWTGACCSESARRWPRPALALPSPCGVVTPVPPRRPRTPPSRPRTNGHAGRRRRERRGRAFGSERAGHDARHVAGRGHPRPGNQLQRRPRRCSSR